ncbi:hypothetical protein QUF61_17485 [Candidatus Venteria ishoeyi]|nr:hypothetical protein [Candidatus Venteria ishoeyi]MDM8548287.1 hypothetical protein [Candidatus Venteria ishoeyi]
MSSAPIFFLAFANDWQRFLPGLADEIRTLQSLLERPDSLCQPIIRSGC